MTEPLVIGDRFPDFALVTREGHQARLVDYAGHKFVIYFYPKDDTPGCTTENRDYSSLLDDFARCDTALLGVSKDTPERHRRFTEKHELRVTLASDAAENGLSDQLGIWGEKQNYGKKYMGMTRTTLLVGSDGRIMRIWQRVKVKGHAAEVLQAAQALS